MLLRGQVFAHELIEKQNNAANKAHHTFMDVIPCDGQFLPSAFRSQVGAD